MRFDSVHWQTYDVLQECQIYEKKTWSIIRFLAIYQANRSKDDSEGMALTHCFIISEMTFK